MLKYLLLVFGSFLLSSAFVGIISWGVVIALVNFYPEQANKISLPGMLGTISVSILQTVELAFGLLCVNKALNTH